MMFLAQTFTPPPAGSEWSWILNALAWLSVIALIATLALALKKLFGRDPSFNQTIAGLATAAALEDYKKEQHLRNRGLEEQISKIRHDFDARANSDMVAIERRAQELFNQIKTEAAEARELGRTVTRLEERTETHIRKLDQNDARLDGLLNRLGLTVRYKEKGGM